MNAPAKPSQKPTLEQMTKAATEMLNELNEKSGKKPSPQAVKIAARLIAKKAMAKA